RVNPTGNPGMATAGMGDVLSGVIGALLAAGLSPSDAATVGAYWHGAAGDLCAKEIGAIGYLASDVASRLPQARAKIRSSCENR
ncbi:MAG: bifunctional ADP-dependent NAD(P)H-hydrate dehydratase/NAD(P)H-hydrate epimerase, partial [Chthonomonas sp.]|nr:bifunctional ADP-dependent NAD(P)H-hydrate dehydratase/NAD(P)H-hydrate epimerase [Chthonomonas sp.]